MANRTTELAQPVSNGEGVPRDQRAAVGLSTMIALGVGWIGTQVFWAFHTGTMPLFLKGHTDSKLLISVVLSLSGVTGCLVPPVIGYLSDRTSSRFGRRAPYIVGGMLAAAVCLLALPRAGTFAAVAAVSAAMYAAIALAQAPYLSLLPDVTPPEQRSTASGVMTLLGSAGLIAYFAGSASLWEAHPYVVFALVAATAVGAVLVPVAVIREPPAPPPDPGASFRSYLRGVAQATPLLTYFAAQSFCWLGHWMGASFFTLFVVEELGASEGQSQYVPMVFGIVATAAAVPFGILGDRVGRKPVLAWCMAAWAATGIAITFARTFNEALVVVALMAIPFAALMTVGYAFMLDLIPGERTAEFVGLSVFTVALSQTVGPLLGGVLIDTLGYRSVFPAGACAFAIGLAFLLRVRVPPRAHVAR